MTESSRILALDFGERRIGVAVSDATATVAQPLTVLTRASLDSDLAAIGRLVAEYEVSEVVVGYPRALRGEVGRQARLVDAFMAELRKRVAVPVRRWDERLTTSAAARFLLEAGVRRQRRREVADKIAAALILQSFLDRRRGEGLKHDR